MTIKIAGAPISWGVCEVPRWGYQLHRDRVLTEMRAVGLTATELGPDGFLPADPVEMTAVLAAQGLTCVGGFVPVVLHETSHSPTENLTTALASLRAVGAEVLVLAAITGSDGYDSRTTLDDHQWNTLLSTLDLIHTMAADVGVLAVLHPHVGTMVQSQEEVDRVLDGSSIPLCLDTGHLLIGGADPLTLARAVPERIKHVHLKDVNAALVDQVRAGELTYTDAVRAGMYTPLGAGDIDLADIVAVLRDHGFDGWYVLEQDTILDGEPLDAGPMSDMLASIAHLAHLGAIST